MGREILAAAADFAVQIVAEIENAKAWEKLKPESLDGVIDFSSPAGTLSALAWCLKHEKPLVSGTTGLSPADKNKIKKASEKIPLLYSANMSLGIAVIVAMMSQLRGLVRDWKFSIEETITRKKGQTQRNRQMLQAPLEAVTR